MNGYDGKIAKAVRKSSGSFALYNSGVLANYLKEHPDTFDIKCESQAVFSGDIRSELNIGVEFPDEDAFKEFYKKKIDVLKDTIGILEKATA